MQYDHISTFATVARGESIPFRANGNKSAIDSSNRDRRTAATAGETKREYTAEEIQTCSIEAMRNGGTCEACQ